MCIEHKLKQSSKWKWERKLLGWEWLSTGTSYSGWRVSSGDIQNLPGHFSVQPTEENLLQQGGWTGWSSEVPPYSKDSVVGGLFSCDSTVQDKTLPSYDTQLMSSLTTFITSVQGRSYLVLGRL